MRPKVLIIDDEPLMHLLYKQHIEKAGYELLAAKDSEEGLARAIAEQPAVLIIDILLTDRDGFATLRALKSNPATQQIPVIIFTGATADAHHATRKEAANSGAAAFVTKPVGPADLVNEIKRLAPIRADPPQAKSRSIT
jgi:two-component system phosphate regulon response regulator PhoB